MKRIKLSKGKHALVDDKYFTSLNKFNWHVNKTPQGHWYAARTVLVAERGSIPNCPSHILMHRQVLGVTSRKIRVDHKNHNTLDNQKDNLRESTPSQNSTHRKRISKSNISGYRGVCLAGKKSRRKTTRRWIAQIRINGKQTCLGGFETPEEAARAYDAEARKHFGAFAGELNFKLEDK